MGELSFGVCVLTTSITECQSLLGLRVNLVANSKHPFPLGSSCAALIGQTSARLDYVIGATLVTAERTSIFKNDTNQRWQSFDERGAQCCKSSQIQHG